MTYVKQYRSPRHKRHARVRAKIRGNAERPRLCVFRSLSHVYAQVIDDDAGRTLVSASCLDATIAIPKAKQSKNGKIGVAGEVGSLVGSRAKEQGITKVVFDRAGYQYQGRVKALAEGARKAGLEF